MHACALARVSGSDAVASSSSSTAATAASWKRLTRQHRRASVPRANPSCHVARSSNAEPEKLAVFVSGGGSNMRAIHDACEDGRVRGKIAVVVTNASDCGGANWARERGIPVLIYPPKKSDVGGLTAMELTDTLTATHGAKFVLLAGYLRLIPPELCRAYENRMLNIHPALLPAFGGKGMHGENVHKAVVDSGARFTGPTIHFVNEEFDKGKIVAQAVVPVLADDDYSAVAARVLKQEHALFPKVVAALCDDRVKFRPDGVPYLVDSDGKTLE